MIDAYEHLSIIQRDMCYFAYHDEVMIKEAFNCRDVPREYRELFGSAPLLYRQLSRTADVLYQLTATIQPVVSQLNPEASKPEADLKILLDNVIEVARLLKADALRCMSIAEVGPKQAMLHHNDSKES